MSLRDHNVIEGVTPIGGGWRYMQLQQDGNFQRIPSQGRAGTARDLVAKVRQYRINAGINIGDVEKDVADYIKKVSPQNDVYKGKVTGEKVIEPKVPLIQRLREWLDSMIPKKPRIITKSEATERARVCMGCRQNIQWKIPCAPCIEEVEYRGITLRGVPSYELDDALSACRLHRIYLPAAVFIDRDELPDRNPKAPDNCWIRPPE